MITVTDKNVNEKVEIRLNYINLYGKPGNALPGTDHHLNKNSREFLFGRDQKGLIPNPRLREPEQTKSKKPKSSIAQC